MTAYCYNYKDAELQTSYGWLERVISAANSAHDLTQHRLALEVQSEGFRKLGNQEKKCNLFGSTTTNSSVSPGDQVYRAKGGM